MLKWLRKYNSIILVVGGVLLMVAWLLPESINQFGRTPFGSAPMRVDGGKVSYQDYDFARREYYALNALLPQYAQMMGAGDNVEHWLLLTHEAEKGGFLSGRHDGVEFLSESARSIARMQGFFMQPEQLEAKAREYADQLVTRGLPRAMGEARLSEDEMYRALGKLHGVARMRTIYLSGPRFSDRRLIAGMKNTDDAASVDYVFLNPDKEVASIADPDAAALQAHFDKYKSLKPGEGEYGVGYLLPDRVKLAWLFVDRNAVQKAITPDPVEVRKRFVKAYPTGQPPAGMTEQAAMAGFENEVRNEQTEKVMRSVDVALKGEFEKATRKLDADAEYKRLPADWKPVDFEKLRDLVVQRVKDSTGVTIPAPAVDIRAANWLTKEDLLALPGIGSSYVQRGNQSVTFPDLVFKVRELAGSNDAVLQTGVPSMDALIEIAGGKYYFEVLAAKKESAPESVDEIKDKAVRDYKRIAAFEKLKAREQNFRDVAISTGLETLAKSSSPDGKGDLEIKRGARVDGNGVGNGDQTVNTEEFRKAILAAAAKIDPLADVSKLDLAQRTVVVPIPKSQGVAVATITAVSPLTVERFRTGQGQAMRTLINQENKAESSDPYSLTRLEERLKVEYLDGRLKEDQNKKNAKKVDKKAT